MALLLSYWRDRQAERQDEKEKGEVSRWRDTDMSADKVFMHVCGQMYTSVRSLAAKKIGTTDITPSAERSERKRGVVVIKRDQEKNNSIKKEEWRIRRI